MSSREGPTILGNLRRSLGNRLDRREVVWLMQRGQWYQLGKLRKHIGIDTNRTGEFRSAMYDTMADSQHWTAGEQLACKSHDLERGAVMVELPLGPTSFGDRPALGIGGLEMCCRTDPFDLSAEKQISAGSFFIEAELDAGGAGIEYGYATRRHQILRR